MPLNAHLTPCAFGWFYGKKTQPLIAVEHGLGCDSTAEITPHGTNNISTSSSVYLTISQAGVPHNIGLDRMLQPILPNHAGPVLFNALIFCCLKTSAAMASAEGMT